MGRRPSQLVKHARLLLPLAVLGIFCLNAHAQAATFSVSASKTSVNIGETFTITAYLDSQGKIINNGEANILFPSSLVEAVTANSAGSIFSIWVQTPSINSSNVSFNGGVPNPGYSGIGKVASLTFTAKAAGEATFSFSHGAIRENDGLGTNVYSGANSVTVTINAATTPPTPSTPTPTPTPTPVQPSGLSAPVISSSTHPDQTAWYATNTAQVNWTLSNGITAIQSSVTQTPTSTPSGASQPVSTHQDIRYLTDGTWYFHLRGSKDGTWSPTAHFKLNIDTQGPTDTSVTASTSPDGFIALLLAAKDAHSGLKQVDIYLDDAKVATFGPEEISQTVTLPAQTLGTHNLTARYIDLAGNTTDSNTNVIVTPSAAPILTSVPEHVKLGTSATISGTSAYADADIVLTITDSLGEQSQITTTTTSDGAFSVTTKALKHAGAQRLTAHVIHDNLSSPTSAEKIINVSAKDSARPVISFHVSLTLVQLLTILTVVLSLLLAYTSAKLVILKRQLAAQDNKSPRKHQAAKLKNKTPST